MVIEETPRFKRSYKERIYPDRELVAEFRGALQMFIEDSTTPVLNDHQLTGANIDKRAFSVTDDIRVVYRNTKKGVLLYDIGTHSQVY